MAVVNSFIFFKELKECKTSLKDFYRRIVEYLLAQKKKPTNFKAHILPEVYFKSSVYQSTCGTLRRCTLCSTNKKTKKELDGCIKLAKYA